MGEFVKLKAEQLLITGYQELGLSGLGEREEVIVVRIR